MIGLNNKKTLLLSSFIIVSVIIASTALYNIVSAASYTGTVYGRKAYHGYFTNTVDYYGIEVLPAISSGDALPSYINTVSEYITLLKGYSKNGNTQKKTGAAFIYNTMLGNDGPGVGKSVTDSDWDQMEYILNNNGGSIDWDVNVSGSKNSYYQGGGDDAFYSKSRSEPGIIFYDSAGTAVYQLLRRCANPMGDLGGITTGVSNYKLSPAVSLSDNIIDAGSTFTVYPSIKNSEFDNGSDNTESDPATWNLTMTVTPTPLPNPSGVVESDAGVVFQPNKTTPLPNYSPPNTDYPAGTKICFVLSVLPRNSDDDSPVWVSSDPPACVVISKSPKIQIWGGDLIVRGSTDTSTTTKSGSTFGSWVEYAIFAGVNVDRTASGAAFAGPGLSVSSKCDYSKLSFSNTTSGTSCTASTTIGGYTNVPAASNLSTSFPATSPSTPAPGGGIPGNWNSGTYSTGDITLGDKDTPSVLTSGKSVIIKSSGTVKIVGNLVNANGPYNNISQLPQLVIIANKIEIADTATQIDAWLYTNPGGSINTCAISEGAAVGAITDLTVSKCKNKLTVNGPVSTDKLYLWRTAGSESGAASGDPAEVFNLRADAYLWAYSRASSTGRITTVYTTELPPRY